MTDKPQNINFTFNRGEEVKTDKSAPTPKKTKKDFKKIFSKDRQEEKSNSKGQEFEKKPKTESADTDYEDVELKLEAYDEKPKAKGASLFDIASTSVEEADPEIAIKTESVSAAEEEPVALDEMPKEIREESLSALFKGYGTKEKLAMIQKEVASQPIEPQISTTPSTQSKQLPENKAAHTPLDDLRKPVEPSPSQTSKNDPFPREQTDLAAVNPNAGQPPQTAPAAPTQADGVQQTPSRVQELQEIVDQIVSKLYTLSSTGKTDTLVQLQRPPLFAGASVVITSFDSARGEFNITFENLTQAAKQMIDMQENQNGLKLALEQKGYTVHILTATTLSETTQIVEGQSPEGERRGSGDESSKERQEQEHEEESN